MTLDWSLGVNRALSIIWNGLPTHVLEVQQYQNFHLFNLVSALLVLIFAYCFIQGNFVENLTLRFSQYLFGNSKPALASIFRIISSNIVHSLFVSITLVTLTVRLTKGLVWLLWQRHIYVFQMPPASCL